MSNVQAIKCENCGAPSYGDQARKGFVCPFCGDYIPWIPTRAHYTPDIVFRHRPVPMIDGYLKLTHVGLPETEPKDMKFLAEKTDRACNTKDKLSKLDLKAFKAWNAREMIEVSCKYCNAIMTGSSTQNIFECKFCNNKIMDKEAFANSVYREEIFGYDHNMYSKAVPFAVSKEEAKRQILQLISDAPEHFKNQEIEKRLDTDLQALYLPYRLEDISVKATVETERGNFTFYHERINWAIPKTAVFDIHLMNKLHPWDFGKTTSFTPAFLEGNVQIFSPQNNEDVDLAMNRMLWRDIPNMVSGTFGLKNVKPLTWVYDFRRHKYAYFNLPIWFLDKRHEDTEKDLQVRVAVNGQTGKVAALFLRLEQEQEELKFLQKLFGKVSNSGQKDYILTRKEASAPKMSDECTMYSPPVPVAYVKSPFLYKTMSLSEALRK